MGLFEKKKWINPREIRYFLEGRVPDTPHPRSLDMISTTTTGSYRYGYESSLKKDSVLSREVREKLHASLIRTDAAIKKLKVGDERRHVLGFLVRDPQDWETIWLEIEGVRVDSLFPRVAAEYWGGLTKPYPVLCAIRGGREAHISIQRYKEPDLYEYSDGYINGSGPWKSSPTERP